MPPNWLICDFGRLAPRAVRIGVLRIQRFVAEEFESAAMTFVRAGLRDDIDDRAAGAAELSRKAVLIHLKFLDRLFGKLVRRARARAAERLAEESVVVVRAVDLQAVERAFLSADRQVACCALDRALRPGVRWRSRESCDR